jgi:PEP-CTERM motif
MNLGVSIVRALVPTVFSFSPREVMKMKWRNIVTQICLGVLLICGAIVPEAQANSIWTYEGSGIDTDTQEVHTVMAYLELDFGPTVFAVTPFFSGNVVNSAFAVSGPNFQISAALTSENTFTFDASTLAIGNGEVLPLDNLGCTECLWTYFGGGGGVIQTLSSTILNGNEWELVAQVIQVPVLSIGQGPSTVNSHTGGNIVGEFILRGTGQWIPPTITSNPIPEPDTVFLLGAGLVVLIGWQIRNRKA